jgi:hypothetical protein
MRPRPNKSAVEPNKQRKEGIFGLILKDFSGKCFNTGCPG